MMSGKGRVLPVERIENRILEVRGERVIIDADLARFYGVSTRRLNEQVRRNIDRFPPDFMFPLTPDEKKELVANCDQFSNLKHSTSLPLAYTEHGAIMAANVLNAPRAIEMGVFVVRAFIDLRRNIVNHKEMVGKLAEIEQRLTGHDQQIAAMVKAIKTLLNGPQVPRKRRIGFNPKDS